MSPLHQGILHILIGIVTIDIELGLGGSVLDTLSILCGRVGGQFEEANCFTTIMCIMISVKIKIIIAH